MCPVAEIAEPGFERGRVVLLHHSAVGHDGRDSGDGRPFARGVEECDVDVWVGDDVVGLAGFGVGVEDEIDAAGFLLLLELHDLELERDGGEDVPWRLKPCIWT